MSHTRLKSIDDIEHLKDCPMLSIVDVSHNQIENEDVIEVRFHVDSNCTLHTLECFRAFIKISRHLSNEVYFQIYIPNLNVHCLPMCADL